jgi:hypothetical protein
MSAQPKYDSGSSWDFSSRTLQQDEVLPHGPKTGWVYLGVHLALQILQTDTLMMKGRAVYKDQSL